MYRYNARQYIYIKSKEEYNALWHRNKQVKQNNDNNNKENNDIEK